MESVAFTAAEMATAVYPTVKSVVYAAHPSEMPMTRGDFTLPTVSDKVLEWVRIGEVIATVLISIAALYATWSIRSINAQTNKREKSERIRILKAERMNRLMELTNVIMRHRELFQNTPYPIHDGNMNMDVILEFDVGDRNDDITKIRSDINFVIVKKRSGEENTMSFMYRGEYEVEPYSILFNEVPGEDSDTEKWDMFLGAFDKVVNERIGGAGAYTAMERYSLLPPEKLSEETGLVGKVRGHYSMNNGADKRFKDAIVGVNLGEVERMMTKITHIDARDLQGRTFLHYAVYSAYDRLWHTSEYGGDSEAKDSRDDDYASRMQTDLNRIVDLLIKNGADVNSLDNPGAPVIYMAALIGNSSAVKRLVESGARVNASSEYSGMNAIQIASFGARSETVETLIRCGADINSKGPCEKTSLHFAIENLQEGSDTRIVEILIEGGARVSIKDEDGMSPVDLMKLKQKDGIDFSEILNAISS